LPNAPYILTDFIHLGRVGGAPLWFDAALIGTFAAAGLALGLGSLLVVHDVVEARAGRVVGWAVAVSSLGLSAIGIYLGRFPALQLLGRRHRSPRPRSGRAAAARRPAR
jgi:uncharacterized membrane protein